MVHCNGKLIPSHRGSERGGKWWVYLRQLTESHRGDLVITCFVEPKLASITFLVDTGAQISAIKTEGAVQSGINFVYKAVYVCRRHFW